MAEYYLILNQDGTNFAIPVVCEGIIGPTFIPVESIDNVPSAAEVDDPLILTGDVIPTNATNQAITWTVNNVFDTTVIDVSRYKIQGSYTPSDPNENEQSWGSPGNTSTDPSDFAVITASSGSNPVWRVRGPSGTAWFPSSPYFDVNPPVGFENNPYNYGHWVDYVFKTPIYMDTFAFVERATSTTRLDAVRIEFDNGNPIVDNSVIPTTTGNDASLWNWNTYQVNRVVSHCRIYMTASKIGGTSSSVTNEFPGFVQIKINGRPALASGATITNGNELNATFEGIVDVMSTIEDGLDIGTDYVQSNLITVSVSSFVPVEDIIIEQDHFEIQP